MSGGWRELIECMLCVLTFFDNIRSRLGHVCDRVRIAGARPGIIGHSHV